MPESENQISRLEARVTELESSQMHFQKDYDSLNEVILDLSGKIDRMSLVIERLTRKIESTGEAEAPRSLEDEKPPHY